MKRATLLALALALAGCVLVTGNGTYIHKDITHQGGVGTTNLSHKFELDLR